MFFNTKTISDLVAMLDQFAPSVPIIIKGYTKINDAVNKPNDPDAVLVYCGEDADIKWLVWDFDPACPCGVDDIDTFFGGCTIFGAEIDTRYDGDTVNAIIIYRDLWG